MVVRQMVVDAVLLEGRSVREVARSFGVSKSFVAKMVARFREGGLEALEPRSRGHLHDPQKSPPELEERVIALRKELEGLGVDHGAATIQSHLSRELAEAPSVSTVHRILVRRGFVTPAPQKRPKSSFIRFEADQPNEMWQSDFTEWRLTDGSKVEILNFLDDHSRLLIASRALRVVRGPDVTSTFLQACELWGVPAAVLTDIHTESCPTEHLRAAAGGRLPWGRRPRVVAAIRSRRYWRPLARCVRWRGGPTSRDGA